MSLKRDLRARAVLLVLLGCFPARERVGRYRCGDLADAFFSKPVAVQEVDFAKHTLDEQYAIYICGCDAIEPPALYLSSAFAKEGPAVVGFFKTEISGGGGRPCDQRLDWCLR